LQRPRKSGVFFFQQLFLLRRTIQKDKILAKTNYSFEKRQKELAKKKKKEEKRQQKLEKQKPPSEENESLSPPEE